MTDVRNEQNANGIAVFGGGCFWCTEAIFKELRGVIGVTPGYTGGTVANPTYEDVSSGTTGHVEATKIEYDQKEVSYKTLLTVFFATHDPTSLNRQGNDVGTQYRSAIFYADEMQKEEVKKFIEELNKEGGNAIVTELNPLSEFYVAEDYHMNYYESHKNAPYCMLVIAPKLEKLHHTFAELLKSNEQK